MTVPLWCIAAKVALIGKPIRVPKCLSVKAIRNEAPVDKIVCLITHSFVPKISLFDPYDTVSISAAVVLANLFRLSKTRFWNRFGCRSDRGDVSADQPSCHVVSVKESVGISQFLPVGDAKIVARFSPPSTCMVTTVSRIRAAVPRSCRTAQRVATSATSVRE
jgi:hypothetical protein